jgi:hypothetical protein
MGSSDGAASGDADKLARILAYAAGSQWLVGYVSPWGFWVSWKGRPDD